MSDIKLIPDSDVAPMQPLTPQILSDAFVESIDGVRELAFGMKPPLLVLAHDHGASRGEVLERPIVTWSLGPSSDTLTAGAWAAGIPVYPPSTGSFAVTPKLLACCGILIGGNIGDITVRLAADLGGVGARSVTFKVEIRTFSDAGLSVTSAAMTTITISKANLATGLQEGTGTISEERIRDVLGFTGLDREAEVKVWLTTNPATTMRLFSVMLTGEMVSTFDASPVATQVTSTISPIEIQQGRQLVDVLGTKLKRRLNQATYNVLGKIPGMATLTQEDDTLWGRNLTAPHQHTGKSEGDGACVRQGMWSQPFCVDLGVVGATMNTSNVLGVRSVTSGSLGLFEGRVSMPVGLGRIYARFAVSPSNSNLDNRLIVQAIVDDNMSSGTPANNYATAISTPTFAQDNALSIGLAIGCQVNPIDTALWKPIGDGNRPLWTQRELLATQPSGKSPGVGYRITELVTIDVDLPSTSDYRVKLTCGIETPVGSGTYDSNALIQWAYFVPAFGY